VDMTAWPNTNLYLVTDRKVGFYSEVSSSVGFVMDRPTYTLNGTDMSDVALVATGTPYETYFEGAQFVHFLLGPATVAIAVPLVRHLVLVRANIVPMVVALFAGAVTAVVSVVAVGTALGVPREILVSLAPKSVTAGIAMAITENMGGRPALTAVLVVATGVMGAVIVTPLMNALKITDYAARGFAVGLASHGIGTARAFAVDEIAGTFAGIAMGLNGIATSLIVPLLLRWL